MSQEQEKQKETPVKSTPAAPKKSNTCLIVALTVIFVFLVICGIGGYFGWKWWKNRSATSGKGLTLTDNCPKNIPIYPKSKILKFTCKEDASSIESIINVDQKQVKAWYLENIQKAGWTIRGEDTASYLFDNDTEIGKVSLSKENKNTVVKFLTAKRNASSPRSASTPSSNNFDSLTNWDDYFNSIPSDYESPADDSGDWEDYVPPEEIDPGETNENTNPDPDPEPNCWIDDKGFEYCE